MDLKEEGSIKVKALVLDVVHNIDVVDQLLETCPDDLICVYHEIVHNRHVVDRFKDQGVRFVDKVEDVPDGAILVFSAHGISPLIRQQARERNLVTVDATCPLVTKVHAEAIRYARRGWQILLIGHLNHIIRPEF